MTGIFIDEKEEKTFQTQRHRHAQREDGHVETEPETGGTQLQAKGCQLPVTTRNKNQARQDSFLEPTEGTQLCQQLGSGPLVPSPVRAHFLLGHQAAGAL